MPMLTDLILDGEFEGWHDEEPDGEYWILDGRVWLVLNGQVHKVGN